MASSSYSSSVRPGEASMHGSFWRLVPQGYRLTCDQSDTNSTTTGISGPGRIVGSVLTLAARRFERAVDQFAEEKLGLGPHQAALRLTSALHELHVQANPGCDDDHIPGLNTHQNITDRLIWACNGFCSHCRLAYLPFMLRAIPEPVMTAMNQLMKYLQPTQHITSIGFSSLYIRLLVQSNILAPSTYQLLDLFNVMGRTRDKLMPLYASHYALPEELIALKSAMSAIQRACEVESFLDQVRFPLTRIRQWEDDLETPSEHFGRISYPDEWGAREIAHAQMKTWRSVLMSCSVKSSVADALEQLDSTLQSSFETPVHTKMTNASVLGQNMATYMNNTAPSLEHGSDVYSVAWCPDSALILSGSEDHTIRMWDSKTGRQTAIINGHVGPVNSVTFSPNGILCASGSADATVRLWNAMNGSSMAVINTDLVYSVAFSPDGAKIASGLGDHKIRLYDVGTGLQASVLISHHKPVRSIAYSSHGAHFASGSNDRTARLWDVRIGRHTVVLKHNDAVRSLAFSPDGWTLASSSSTSIRLWDARTGRQVYPRPICHRSSIGSVAFAPNGQHLASASVDETVCLWGMDSLHWSCIVFDGHNRDVNSVAFSPDGKYIASGSHDHTIRVWDVSMLRL